MRTRNLPRLKSLYVYCRWQDAGDVFQDVRGVTDEDFASIPSRLPEIYLIEHPGELSVVTRLLARFPDLRYVLVCCPVSGLAMINTLEQLVRRDTLWRLVVTDDTHYTLFARLVPANNPASVVEVCKIHSNIAVLNFTPRHRCGIFLRQSRHCRDCRSWIS
ncbi:hypothetical protein K470DRAFT_40127 [Piedraia hortae CBS 480.64]|uniref:Uncharacterized protein n=1 Tax=Piedraia hortae CBS 480.64 TaxID=1314780 RepID=A0A6A7C2P4_9PEZI|nr:hypothetical protein K470DRAFT_40127 [Piedraia hortae CBS 480.64]